MSELSNNFPNTTENLPVENPRQKIIDEVQQAYHLHFVEGLEGAELNPESAEFNLDTLLVTTKMITDDFVTTPKDSSTKKHIEWEENPDIDWYFEKYKDMGVKKSDFSSRNLVVQKWLFNLGPHNEMDDANEHLEKALSNLENENIQYSNQIVELNNAIEIEGSKESPTQSLLQRYDSYIKHYKDAISKNNKLNAELAFELCELPISLDDNIATEKQSRFRKKALGYYQISEKETSMEIDEKLQQDSINLKTTIAISKKIQALMLTHINISYLEIEAKRQEILGHSQLTLNYSEEQYEEFKSFIDAELATLAAVYSENLTINDSLFEKVITDDEKSNIKKSDEYSKSLGYLLEPFVYIRALSNISLNEDIFKSKIRPSTIREDKGEAHKQDEHDNKRIRKNEVGEDIKLEPNGFNYNFDFATSILVEDRNILEENGRGFINTAYLQIKKSSEYAKTVDLTSANGKFFAGKNYSIVTPDEINYDIRNTDEDTYDLNYGEIEISESDSDIEKYSKIQNHTKRLSTNILNWINLNITLKKQPKPSPVKLDRLAS